MEISDRIKLLRKELKLTQNKLAERSGIHLVSIKKYETNKEYVWKYIKINDKKWDLRNVDPNISSNIDKVDWKDYIII